MAIDLDTETLITFKEARAEFPQNPSRRTIERWALVGYRKAWLETVMSGGTRVTSREACRRFLKALNSSQIGDTEKP